MSLSFPILSLLIWTPIIGAVMTVMSSSNPNRARWISLVTILVSIALCVPLYTHFDSASAVMQFKEHLPWITTYHINYDLGVDGISVAMILLTTVTTLIVVLSSWKNIQTKVAQYMATFLVMQGVLVGVFAALDAMLFFVFWEVTLIPMYLIIGIWGSSNRLYAAIKFFIYTFFGSALMFVAFLYMYTQTGSFAIEKLYALPIGMTAQILIFIAFFLSFAVKIPMWPVHTWLPDAHTEAPAGGSIVLAAVLLKLGGYGFLRFALPIVPDASLKLAPVIIGLSLIAVIYIGFVALVQKDMKRLIAYSSIAHMGFVTLGFFMIFAIVANTGHVDDAALGFDGAVIQMISHGFISGALFLGIGVLYDRMHTRLIKDFGGIANTMPVFASFLMFFALANSGLPGTSGFVGELMVVISAFKASFWIALLSATTLILAPAYSLWMYKRVFFGEVANDKVKTLKDINALDIGVFSLLALFVLGFGFYPEPMVKLIHAASVHIVDISQHSKL